MRRKKAARKHIVALLGPKGVVNASSQRLRRVVEKHIEEQVVQIIKELFEDLYVITVKHDPANTAPTGIAIQGVALLGPKGDVVMSQPFSTPVNLAYGDTIRSLALFKAERMDIE